MTLDEIRDQVMFQTNNDADDVEDFLPSLNDYINEAYDRLVSVWAKAHVPSTAWPALRDPLESETSGVGIDTPKTPEWTHRYLADWATWLVYRNGNPQKQQRGYAYREAFLGMLSTISDQGGADGLNEDGSQKQYKFIINIPR